MVQAAIDNLVGSAILLSGRYPLITCCDVAYAGLSSSGMGPGKDQSLRAIDINILKHSEAIMVENLDVTDAAGALIDAAIEHDKIIPRDQSVSGLVQQYLNILGERSVPVVEGNPAD